jgi:hypothetical protein
MLDHTDLPFLRHRTGRLTALAGVMLVLSLFPGPAAHAGDGGLLDDVTDVAGAVTEPVVDPALEAVETVVPPVEEAVEPVVEEVVEPTVSQVEDAVEKATGDDRGAPPEGEAPAQVEEEGPGDGPRGEPAAQAAEPVTASQPAPASVATAPTAPGSGHTTGDAGRGDESGNTAADRSRGGQRPSAASCDGISDLPPRGAAAPAVQAGRDLREAGVTEASRGDARLDDRSEGSRAFVLPGDGGPAPALVAPDPVRALWLTGLVALVMMLTAGLTVVLVRELE